MEQQRGTKTLESFLMPGTPPSVRSKYLSLAERARQTSFGLLEEDIVMLDTETTGLSFRESELIEIAAARISGDTIVDRFQTFVHPSGPIPAEIQVLTGITDLDVSNAPSAEEAVRELAAFVRGQPVVAHNASFDRTFIERVPGGRDVSDTWIDSLSLSRIALPRITSHRLADMAEAFGCASVTHRAMADVDALCGMWRILLMALSDLPAGMLANLSEMHQDVPWTLRPLFAHFGQAYYGARFSLKDHRRELVAQSAGHKRQDAMDCFGARSAASDNTLALGPRAPQPEGITQAFGANGVVASMYGAYEQRPEQVAMALEVRGAQATSTHRAIEAGTGVGKSMAYLLPSILFARANDVTVGVATKTNALTDQLVTHDLPALQAGMPGGVSFCSIKGYDHYPCLRRLEASLIRKLPLDRVEHDGRSDQAVAADMLTAMATIMGYACQSPEGDLDALGIRWRYVPRDMLTTSPAECARIRCPFYPNECFVHGARRRASCADIVVTNHSLLLRDISLDNAILPPIRHWIVDEAHSFEQEARRQWAQEFSVEAARNVFTTLGSITTGVIHSIMARSATLDGSTLITGLLTKASSAVQRASDASSDLTTAIHGLIDLSESSGGYDNIVVWIDSRVRETLPWQAVVDTAAVAFDSYEQASKSLDEAVQALAPESAQMSTELGEATRTLKTLASALKLIVLEPDESYVYSAELYRAKRRMVWERLVAEKLKVGDDLAKRWYPEIMSVSYTSATIAIGDDFSHFNHAIGFDLLPDEAHKAVRLNSSYDFDRNMSVIVARDMPAPGDRAYLERLENLLYDVHVAMQGSVLTLFTNRREMEQVFKRLRSRLAAAGLEVVCQERGTSPRRLRERFMAEEQLSLMALKSFWEGFDAAGDTLRCVVIPKLPFASPRDPLVRERELREPRAWWRFSLPEAVLSVKQAAGRLIRTSSDTGVLVIADSRVSSKRYGQTFIRALPSKSCSMLETRNIARFIKMWNASRR